MRRPPPQATWLSISSRPRIFSSRRRLSSFRRLFYQYPFAAITDRPCPHVVGFGSSSRAVEESTNGQVEASLCQATRTTNGTAGNGGDHTEHPKDILHDQSSMTSVPTAEQIYLTCNIGAYDSPRPSGAYADLTKSWTMRHVPWVKQHPSRSSTSKKSVIAMMSMLP